MRHPVVGGHVDPIRRIISVSVSFGEAGDLLLFGVVVRHDSQHGRRAPPRQRCPGRARRPSEGKYHYELNAHLLQY